MSKVDRYDELTDEQLELLHDLCERFESAIRQHQAASIEEHLEAAPKEIQSTLFRDLLEIELVARVAGDDLPHVREYQTRFPDYCDQVLDSFAELPGQQDDSGNPDEIGRYRIQKRLGSGGFGLVYLGWDDQLNRGVAIKVPRRELVARRDAVHRYLDEAQSLASLDHPHIVPVYDVGRSDEFPCYVVSKHIDGTDLGRYIKNHRLPWRAAAELVANMADALHHAHTRGLVHRDVKPANILLDKQHNAYLADFGVSIRDFDDAKSSRFVGTPAYMSPEQARGEGHRVDGRSDIYSLGTVLYELLTGRRTVSGNSRLLVMDRIAHHDPKPPRQIDDSIPRDLERICLKALAKRISERYTTALDMADELREFLGRSDSELLASSVISVSSTDSDVVSSSQTQALAAGSDSEPIPIVPRGLRAYDEHDSDFFLRLLPGPRNRDGIPDNVLFWKTRIEEQDADRTFQLGLIYGPSGSGKSSFVRAGLLPRLANHVTVVFVEASPGHAETRILKELRKQCRNLNPEWSLKESLSALRRGKVVVDGKKVLIVLDQFEQWLHGKTDFANEDLVDALRQCDGARVQCLVLVRDDFWLAISRLAQDLEVDLVQGDNIALVDLFDRDHAKRVLRALGRAFGKLSEQIDQQSPEQRTFLDQAVQGLTEGDKVACVRVSLFAEMMKSRDWTPSNLKAIGGTQGVGVTFLEETFSSPSANPRHRHHQRAARAVLGELLLPGDSDIKGRMQSYEELLQASGYQERPKDFQELIRILDSELRLITPTDPEGFLEEESGERLRGPDALSQRYYQLTHDYLVHALRDWLSFKQQETRRGRAEIRLAESSQVWNRNPVNRNLPSVWEWATIGLLSEKSRRTTPQHRMMNKAARFHLKRLSLGLVAIFSIAMTIQYYVSAAAHQNLIDRTRTAVESMRNSRGILVPHTIEGLKEYPAELVTAELHARFAESNPSQKLALTYAQAALGSVDVDFLVAHVAKAPASEVDNLAVALERSPELARAALRQALERAKVESNWSLRQRLAVIGLYLGDTESAQEMCVLRPDRVERLQFTLGWSGWHGDLIKLAQLAPSFDDPLLRASICVGIGGIPSEYVSDEVKRAWQPVLCDWVQTAREPSVHSASLWLLQQWNVGAPEIVRTQEPLDGFGWHLNRAGMTMIQVPAGLFRRRYGKDSRMPEHPEFLDASIQEITLTQGFLVSDTEVTVEQYRRMKEDDDYPDSEKPFDGRWGLVLRPNQLGDPIYSPTDQHPVQWVNWNDAVQFCNWLSRREGLAPCYERTGHVWKIPTGEFEEWKLISGANGYRLPTEAEWEYVCRAGNATQVAIGDEVNTLLLEAYASGRTRRAGIIGAGNSTDPVRSKPPDGWGLFDLHGNVNEWCNDWYQYYHGRMAANQQSLSDPQGPAQNDGRLNRVLRGGIFLRSETPLSVGRQYLGFRVVRTFAR